MSFFREVLPHGILWSLSFEAGHLEQKGRGRTYLDDICDLSYLTPATLSRLAAGQDDKPVALVGGDGFLFVGPDRTDPERFWRIESKNAGEARRGVKRTEFTFEPVLATDADHIEAQVPSGEPLWKALSGALAPPAPRAPNRRFLEEHIYSPEVAAARWLHINGHGVPEDEWEEHVAIVLNASLVRARATDGERHFLGPDYRGDGVLTHREVESLVINAEFVFLHGCSTSEGDLSFSAGSLGTISAFRSAGARLVIATHWEIASDPGIEQEIANSYKNVVITNIQPQESLRRLRKTLRQSGLPTRDRGGFSVYR